MVSNGSIFLSFGCAGSSLLCKLSLVAASRGYSLVAAWWLLIVVLSLVWRTGSRHTGSVVVAHGLSFSMTRGIFLHQGLNPCPLIGRQILNHWTIREVQQWIF